ncbi:hypothetical protein RR48_12897 [Papilio machaon]|uniref:Uncharacterized protein n=1 Tax=Papilio machaon TaxID=76193 RepID=A0A194QRL8_PAPMA|nr:hypothetical protein RR48_12897 [Papilio machaon]
MAPSRSALLSLAALAALAGCCVCAPQGSVQGGVQGGAQVPPGVPHSTAPPPPAGIGGVRKYGPQITYSTTASIQSVFQRAWVSRLADPWRSHAHQFAVAQPTTARDTETARQRGGVHSFGAADRVRDGGGGVLAVRQLLVARAGGCAGRLTRGGGRLHTRLAPARRGIARDTAAAAPAPRAHPTARREPSLPRRLPRAALRYAAAAFLTPALLLSPSRKN